MNPIVFILGGFIIFFISKFVQIFDYGNFILLPGFLIIFLLLSKKEERDIWFFVFMGFIFDIFSGFTFGFITMVVIIVALTIHFIKRYFQIEQSNSIMLVLAFIFVLTEYMALFAIQLPWRTIYELWPSVVLFSLGEFVVVYGLFWWIISKNMKKTF